MGRRTDHHPQLDLRLNLSPPPPDNHYHYGDHDDGHQMEAESSSSSSPVRSTCSSSCDQNSSTEEVTPPAMVVVGCPRCLMYVMLSEVDPKCPKCKSSALLHDFINHDQHQPSSSTIFPN